MIRPTEKELSVLTPMERASYALGDFFARYASSWSVAWNSSVLVATTWVIVRRRLQVHGLEHIRALDPERGVIMVANHRSFFDFFAVECALFSRTRMSRRLLFPVRSNFFYDHPLGLTINFLLAGMTMFPPILRDPRKRSFNQYVLRRCAAEVEENGVVLGLHPEGTRNPSPDPLALLPGKLGIGEVLLAAPTAQVVPVFLSGLGNSFREELRRNWREPEGFPVRIGFGAPLVLDDLFEATHARRAQREAVRRAMTEIRIIGERVHGTASPTGSSQERPGSLGGHEAPGPPAPVRERLRSRGSSPPPARNSS